MTAVKQRVIDCHSTLIDSGFNCLTFRPIQTNGLNEANSSYLFPLAFLLRKLFRWSLNDYRAFLTVALVRRKSVRSMRRIFPPFWKKLSIEFVRPLQHLVLEQRCFSLYTVSFILALLGFVLERLSASDWFTFQRLQFKP